MLRNYYGGLEMTEASAVEIVKSSEVFSLIQKSVRNVRPEMMDNPYILEAIKVLPVGGYRSAIGSFWNAVVDDLRNKIMFRSLSLFNKEMKDKLGNRAMKTYEDFQNYVNDEMLIDGAYKIGVIGWEAHKVLKQAKETRHIFDGHPKSSDPSVIKVLGMMEDCIKYVLNVEFPMQIIDIDEYIVIMDTNDYDRNAIAIENALGDLPENYKNELINRLFTAYIHPDCSTILRSNIEFTAPIMWKVLPKDVKIQVVRRLDREIPKGNATTINRAFSFIEVVGGMRYLSTFTRKYRIEPLIIGLTESLDEWAKENDYVKDLERFSSYVPGELLPLYVNALTQTYIGHIGSSYNYARSDFYADGAALRIPGMFEKFDDTAADAFLNTIRTNRTIQSRIQHPRKMRRLRSLANIVFERVSENYHDREILELLVDETKEQEFYKKIGIHYA